jgi:hypothetical protein
MTHTNVVLVADPGPMQVGGHLLDAAAALQVRFHTLDVRQAFEGISVLRRAAWRLGGHRPLRLASFSAGVVEAVRRKRPTAVLATGLAPLTAPDLRTIGALGVTRINFLTDDPWNPVHRAAWFLDALPSYDVVFTPRRATIEDLQRAGVPRIEYLPFGYNPAVHRFEPPLSSSEGSAFQADVVIAGGGDRERVALVAPLIRAGLSVALYGGYWDRFRETRAHARGMIGAQALRKAIGQARVSLGLVRRANRDGHAMRTFEVPAMRGCLLAERTRDHLEIFGRDREAVVYFDGAGDVVDAARWILARPDERDRLVGQASALIVGGRHTYADRLAVMLGAAA